VPAKSLWESWVDDAVAQGVDRADAEAIFQEMKRMLNDLPYRDCMIRNLNKIRSMMENKKPSARVASMIGEITGWSRA